MGIGDGVGREDTGPDLTPECPTAHGSDHWLGGKDTTPPSGTPPTAISSAPPCAPDLSVPRSFLRAGWGVTWQRARYPAFIDGGSGLPVDRDLRGAARRGARVAASPRPRPFVRVRRGRCRSGRSGRRLVYRAATPRHRGVLAAVAQSRSGAAARCGSRRLGYVSSPSAPRRSCPIAHRLGRALPRALGPTRRRPRGRGAGGRPPHHHHRWVRPRHVAEVYSMFAGWRLSIPSCSR